MLGFNSHQKTCLKDGTSTSRLQKLVCCLFDREPPLVGRVEAAWKIITLISCDINIARKVYSAELACINL